MSWSTRNSGKQWDRGDVKQLRELAAANTPTRVMGFKLGRTAAAVQSKAQEAGVSLRPANRSPYNRRTR